MYQESRVIIGKHAFSADLGVVQGGVLSPMLFNVYLEEALGADIGVNVSGHEVDLYMSLDRNVDVHVGVDVYVSSIYIRGPWEGALGRCRLS